MEASELIIATYLQRKGVVVDDEARAGMVGNVDVLLAKFEEVSRDWGTVLPERWAREMVRAAILDAVNRGLGLEESRPSREARA